MVRKWFIWVTALLFPLAVVAQLTPGPDAYGDEEQRITAGTTMQAETSSDPSVIESAPVPPVHMTPSDPASTALSVASEPEPSPLELAEDTQPLAVDEPSTTDRIAVDAATPASDTSGEFGSATDTRLLSPPVEESDVAPSAPGDGEDGVLSDGAEVPLVQAAIPSAPRMALRTAAMTPITSIGTTIGTDHPANPGDVMVFKQAEPIEGMVNTWQVTLRIEGMDPTTTADVVLVIDTSGSMGEYGRIQAAKDAANAFIDQLLTNNPNPSNNIRIGIVTFSSREPDGPSADTTQLGLTTDTSTLHNKVNGLAANGGTFTQAGMHVARQMLDSSTAEHKHIVLLSDGQPTYSYRIFNPDNYLIAYPGYGGQTGTDVPEGGFDYTTRVGNGSDLRARYYNQPGTANDRYYNNGNSAIAEAGFAKAEDTRVWTIALSVNEVGQGVLSRMASPDSYYTSEPASLTTVFTTIAGAISAAVNDAEVTDPMGIGFQIPSSQVDNIQASQGPWTYDAATNRLSWDPGTLTDPISPGSNIKYAELIYRIEINDDILGQTPDQNGTYPTNGNATVSYTDANGTLQTGTFPVPRVNPVLYKVQKVLMDSDLDPLVQDRNFTVEVTGPGADGATQTTRSYTLNAAHTSTRLITDLRYASTYTFAEVGNLGDYKVSYQVNGTATTDLSFLIANDQTTDVTITVTNVYEPIEVTGTKTWVDSLTPTPDVWFQLLRVNPDNTTTRIGGPRTVPTGTNQVTWKQTDADVDATEFVKYRPDQQQYVYRVIEVDETGNDHVPAGYTKTELGLAVTNTFVPTTPTNTTSVRFEKTWAGVPADLTPPTLTVRLLADGTVVRTATLTHPTTAVEWQNLPLKDGDGDLISYTVEESQLNDYDESAVAHTTDVISTVTFTDQTTGLDKPSFVITRLSGGANQPFIVWTLNHVGDHTAFLNKVITAAEATGAAPQIIADLTSYLAGGNTYLLWYEGADVAQDVVPADTQAGQIDIDVTFDGDAIDTASVGFQGAVWASFVSGTYSSTLATVTNTHNPTGLTLIKAIDGVGLADLPAGVVTPVEASAFTLSATRDQTVVTGAGRVTSTGLEAGTYALSEATTPGIATDYYAAKGEWVCADDETGLPVTVTNATVKLNSGQQITCTVTNATAALTLLKYLPDGDPTQITLTATPGDQALADLETTGQKLTDGKASISASNTIQVRPGENYTLDESASIAFLRNGLERYTGPDPANPDMTNAAHWVSVDSATVSVAPGEHAVYRFVNRTAPAVPIPLTGGVGRTAFLVSSALLAVIATATIAAAVRRRDTLLAR